MKRFSFVLALGLVLAAAAVDPRGASAQETRRNIGGALVLEWNGTRLGILRAASGGDIESDVVLEPSTSQYFSKKHIAQPRFSELKLEFGAGMDPSLYEWIAGSWGASRRR